MRLETIRLRGLGPFRDEVSVDLADVPGRVVAVCGDNGAGKSTLLELWGPGALYRSTPTRGALTALATERAAFLEARVVNGKSWTIRHVVDAVSGKGEAVVLDELGAPVLPDSKVRSFDAWAARALPPAEVLFASVFSAQGAGGFLAAKPGERKAVLLRVLGVERLEQLAERAREHARDARAALATLEARLADERARGCDVAAAEEALAEARFVAEQADEAVEQRRDELVDAQQRAAESDRNHTEWRRQQDELRTRRDALTSQIADARSKARDLEQRVENNRNVLAEREAIEASGRLIADWTPLVAEARETWNREGSAAAAAEAERRRCAEAEQSATVRLKKARDRVAAAERRLEAGHAIRGAVERLAAERQRVVDAEGVLVSCQAELDNVSGLRAVGDEERIAGLRKGLFSIWRDELAGDTPQGRAGDTLANDDEAVEDAAEVPKRLAQARGAVDTARRNLDEGRRSLADVDRLAARAPELEAAEQERSQARLDAHTAEEEIAVATAGLQKAQAAIVEHDAKARNAKRVADELTASIAKVEPQAKKAEPLARAEARLAELEPQLATVEQDIARLEQELIATPAPDGLPPASGPALAPYERSVREAEGEARRAHDGLARLEQRLEQARAGAARMGELEGELAKGQAELADWNRLADDLGRDGLQALEIDAAGPELTELVNDLLRNCVGTRWTVSIETTRLSADGKRQLEGCDVRVLDTVRGRDANAETLSGGERVLVGEALSLALSMLACRRAGLEGVTLVRDETGAALDPVNGRAYVAMLRRAAEIVRADKVLFVSHAPELHELADARIEIADGAVRVT